MDQVLGRGHLPTMDDIPKLQVFEAVFKESFRWNPAAPIGSFSPEEKYMYISPTIGIPHMSTKEDVWNGYYIPKGSIIQCNIGASFCLSGNRADLLSAGFVFKEISAKLTIHVDLSSEIHVYGGRTVKTSIRIASLRPKTHR